MEWIEDPIHGQCIKDASGNVATARTFQTVDRALEALNKLVRCRGCVDCIDCMGCRYCVYCIECMHCTGCRGCVHCVSCEAGISLICCVKCQCCSYCAHCVQCSGCESCNTCAECHISYGVVNDANKKQMVGDEQGLLDPVKWDIEKLPVIEDLHKKLYAEASKPCALNMDNWHSPCGTTHCRAGWATHLAGDAGAELEEATSTSFAAAMVYFRNGYKIAPPKFYDSNEAALADMKELAEA